MKKGRKFFLKKINKYENAKKKYENAKKKYEKGILWQAGSDQCRAT